jgi:hypothetical protein
MGHRFKMRYDSPAEVTAEIGRVVPGWGAVQVDDAGPAGRWTGAAPAPVPFDAKRLADRVTPVPTRDLDCVEARFAATFEAKLDAARPRLAAEAAATAP